ncbi:ABC transporter ATP-binding protein [Gordonia sp. (in: high G+C Gram-positive bacteria)]|uniref:ABC transporter ATP-binding protein n=1 Tax=Gordonia sp. (in: high G+C Gram-positive bacteria) TaxID=84139 RepID=UPI003F99B63E
MSTMPVADIVPRSKKMLSRPDDLNTVIAVSAVAGFIEGLALAALLPTITALAKSAAVWGLGLAGWLWILAVLSTLSFIINYVSARRSYDVALDFLRSIHRIFGDQVAKQPLGWFARPVADSLSRLVSTELMMAGEILAHMMSPLVSRGVAAGVVIVAAWVWSPLLGLVLTCAVPAFIVITLVSAACVRRGRTIHEPAEVALANQIVEYAQCQSALRSCGRSGDFAPLRESMDRARSTKKRALWIETAGLLLSGVLTQGVIVVLISITGSLAVSGTLEPIPALAFIGLALRFTSTLSAITDSAMSLESRRPLLDQIDQVLDAQPLPVPASFAELTAPGAVALEAVTFGYDSAAPVLRDFSLEIPAGSMVALVGPSGSGKTTVAKLISRFYDVDAGRVLVGGVPVTEQTGEQLMAQLSMVFQDVYLFDDTLRANIAVGREDATDAEILEAAHTAGVSDIAHRLADGWDSRVGEGGRALSGGERQRVAIARALLKQAPIVLLDEATSALDTENEANIVAAIEKLRTESTVVIIAHRLDTIARADLIVSLTDEGAVEATGTHDELLAAGGTYASYWSRLSRAQGWQLTNDRSGSNTAMP